MVPRRLAAHLLDLASRFPVVTLTGPRQSGKTTLCRAAFPGKPYASLESPDIRSFALTDPRGFLAQFPDGAVLDEIQRAPDLVSYLQTVVDEAQAPGRYLLTGSANLNLVQAISQSLAGRTALLTLLPMSRDETLGFPHPPVTLFETLWTGGYPAILDRSIPPTEWLGAYLTTYVERDVRQLLNVTDLLAFQTFLRLCAGRSGQLLNLSALAADAGITHNTARAWLSVLEASYIVFRLPPVYGNFRKRLVKTPKIHFYDSGLLCCLLGISEPDMLRTHPLRGAVFESWVAAEVLKARLHQGRPANASFYRDSAGGEVDLVVDRGDAIVALEMKSGETVASDFFTALERYGPALSLAMLGRPVEPVVIYGGAREERRQNGHVVPWTSLGDVRLC